jgi:YD repeat-containing protein
VDICTPQHAFGTAYVVARDGSAYGAGWGIAGISQLVAGSAGAMMVTGQGDSEFFAANGSGGFISPAYDFGTLTGSNTSGYTYTAVNQTQYNYNAAGYLTSVVDTHGLATTYEYDSQNRLIQVTAIDGGITTLSYSNGVLSSISEPGGRMVSLGHDSLGNITQITNVDGTTRTFGYSAPTNHLITEDQWSPLDAAFSYNSSTNQLSQVNLGLGSVYTIVPSGSVTDSPWASITDGDGNETQYLLDPLGRLLAQIEPDGTSTTTYTLNGAGLVTRMVDPMGRATSYSYDAYYPGM